MTEWEIFLENIRNSIVTFYGENLLAAVIFGSAARRDFEKGSDLYTTGEVSLTLQVPYYPVAYGLSFCCLVECLVLISGILKVLFGGEHE